MTWVTIDPARTVAEAVIDEDLATDLDQNVKHLFDGTKIEAALVARSSLKIGLETLGAVIFNGVAAPGGTSFDSVFSFANGSQLGPSYGRIYAAWSGGDQHQVAGNWWMDSVIQASGALGTSTPYDSGYLQTGPRYIGTAYGNTVACTVTGYVQQYYIQNSPPYRFGGRLDWGLWYWRALDAAGNRLAEVFCEDPPWAYLADGQIPKDHPSAPLLCPHPWPAGIVGETAVARVELYDLGALAFPLLWDESDFQRSLFEVRAPRLAARGLDVEALRAGLPASGRKLRAVPAWKAYGLLCRAMNADTFALIGDQVATDVDGHPLVSALAETLAGPAVEAEAPGPLRDAGVVLMRPTLDPFAGTRDVHAAAAAALVRKARQDRQTLRARVARAARVKAPTGKD